MHVLAMPVVGTGKGGARGSSGEMIQKLLELIEADARAQRVDVALVVDLALVVRLKLRRWCHVC